MGRHHSTLLELRLFLPRHSQVILSPPSKMSGVVASNNVEEEYLWSCTLSGESKEFSWSPEDPADTKDDDEADPSVKPGHRLLIKTAILMPTAKKDEVTIVQIEGEGYNKSKVLVPICAMKGGKDSQQYVDLLVPCPAKLSLMQGEGPIYLVGSHCVDFYGYRDTGAGDDEDEDEATEDEDADMKEAEDLVNDVKATMKNATPPKEKVKTPAKEEKTKTPVKDEKTPAKEEKIKTPDKDEKEKTPAKEDKKRKASEDQPKSGEKKKKESPAKSD